MSSTKITTNHTTATKTAAEVLHHASTYEEVSKISLGIIKHVGTGERRIKFLPISGGIKAIVRGAGAVQELYIYTSDPDLTQQKLITFFESH